MHRRVALGPPGPGGELTGTVTHYGTEAFLPLASQGRSQIPTDGIADGDLGA